jgi:hypothetical protein
MAKWYIKRNDKQAGPFESAQLKQLATGGKIKPEDLLRREDQDTWVRASAVKGLLAATTQVPISTTTTPPPLPDTNQSPPPLPSAASENKKLPWYHPASLAAYAIIIAVIFLFSQIRLTSTKRVRSPQAQAEKQAHSPKQNARAVDKIEMVMQEAASVTHSTKYRKPDSEVLTADFLPEVSERCFYSQIGRDPRSGREFQKVASEARPLRNNNALSYEYVYKDFVYGINQWISSNPEIIPANHQRQETDSCVVSFAFCGYTHNRTPVVIVKNARVGDSWQLPNKDTYVVEKIEGKRARLKVDRVSLDKTNRNGDFGSVEDVIILERDRGIVSWLTFHLENGRRLGYPTQEIRRTE